MEITMEVYEYYYKNLHRDDAIRVLHRITNMDTWKTHVIFSQTTTTWYERTNMVTTDSMEFL